MLDNELVTNGTTTANVNASGAIERGLDAFADGLAIAGGVAVVLMSLALAKVAAEIRGKRTGETRAMSLWLWVLDWADVLIREIPLVKTAYKRWFDQFYRWWHLFLCRASSTVYNIQLLPTPSNIGAPASDSAVGQVRYLDEAWRRESKLIERERVDDFGLNKGLCDGRERAWLFTPSEDYLIQYSVKHSRLPMSFLAFYPRNKHAIFPPCPLRAYWRTSTLSEIHAACWTWPATQATEPVKSVLLQLIQQTAGPHQQLPKASDSNPADAFANAAEEIVLTDAHAWTWQQWKACFPHVFVPPADATAPVGARSSDAVPAELTAAERRRLSRMKQATSTSTSTGRKPFLLVTRSDQSYIAVPFH